MKIINRMATFILVIAGSYLLLLGLMYIFQNKLLFMPSSGFIQTPDSFGLTAEDIWVETDDGESVHGWYFPNESAEFVVLLSHGNAGNISGRIAIAESLLKSGASVLMYDYRGYGQSSGTPSETGLYRDIEAVMGYLESDLGYPADKVVLYGRSLGGAVSAYAATKFDVGGLVLDSAFINLKAMVSDVYPFVPAAMAKYEFPTDKYLQNLRGLPVMIMHSRDDEIVGYGHGQRLFELLDEPKMFVELQGGHNENFYESREKIEYYWYSYLKGVCGHCTPYMGSGL